MAKQKAKYVMGLTVTEDRPGVWQWETGGKVYEWQPSGLCTWIPAPGEQPAIVCCCPKLEGAVGYSAGWLDGYKSGTHDTTKLLRPKDNGQPAPQ